MNMISLNHTEDQLIYNVVSVQLNYFILFLNVLKLKFKQYMTNFSEILEFQ